MKVLVACEFSGVVRDAFLAKGHEAWSVDLLPSESKVAPMARGGHWQGSISEFFEHCDRIGMTWDLMIAHPPCTYLSNSGVRWLYKGGKGTDIDLDRWAHMEMGAQFFRYLWDQDIPRICIENPVQHSYARAIIGVPYTQTIQPYEFGHGETKRTCLWLKNLPPLVPTNVVDGREARIHRMSPGGDRGKERSRFYTGIAKAMSEQWNFD